MEITLLVLNITHILEIEAVGQNIGFGDTNDTTKAM